ncbi:MAG TPA: Smr/MutS family protein [Chitinophagaceae bacterium]|nr:Smr/MutS family protein [Chitinophagaceae bacterium]
MKYQVGDIVLLLHSNEEGKIVDIINDKMLMVDVQGIVFPVYMDQIDFPYFKRFSEKKLFPPKKEKQYVDDIRKEKNGKETKAENGVWLSFLPMMEADDPDSYRDGDEIVKDLKIYLLNQTHAAYHFKYKQNFFGKPEFELNNQLAPFENFYIHDIAFADLNDNPVFEFEFSLLQPDKKKAEFFESSLKLKPKQIFIKIKQLKENNEATFSYKLFDTYPDKTIDDKFEIDAPVSKDYKVYDAKKARQHLEPPLSVIDLHIEKLNDDWHHLSNYEILSQQLKTFEKYYDLAIAHLQPSLTVIHGIGEGRLRNEIHDILRLKKEVKSFVNQYHPLYGYGATEIFFQY